MGTFDSGYPECILQLLNNFDKAVVRVGNNTSIINISFLQSLLRGKEKRKHEVIIATYGVLTDNYPLETSKELIKYFLPRKVLSKSKRDKRHLMRKTRNLKPQHFTVILQ